MRTVAITIAVYCLMAVICFGDVVSPVADLLLWRDRLGIPLWPAWVFAVALATTAIFWRPIPRLLKAPAYVIAVMVLSVVPIGLFADHVRAVRTARLDPDASISHSFFRSIRNAPREPQFYLHAAALRRCTPYGWSYRKMDFYELPVNVAVNVVPEEWVQRCHMHRS